MFKIFRFSEDGFVPKNQSYHRKILKTFYEPVCLEGLNDYQIKLVQESQKKNKPLLDKLNLKDYGKGVFAFLGSLPEKRWLDLELNHLKEKQLKERRWFEAEIEEFADIYSVYDLIPEMFWTKHFIVKYGNGNPCYVPGRSLKFVKNCKTAENPQ